MCIYLHIHAVKTTTICQMVSLWNMQHYVIYNYMFRPCKWAIIRLFIERVRWLYKRSLGEEISSQIISCGVNNLYKPHKIWCKTRSLPPDSYCIVILLVLWTTWWWPTYKAETSSCIVHSVVYYIVIPSDKLLCFCLHVYVSIYTLYTVILT